MHWRAGRMRTERVWGLRDDERAKRLADTRPSRAVSRNRSSGSQRVLGVESDRFEHEVELIGAVDLTRYRVRHAGPEEQGFGEVIESVNALRVRSRNKNTAHFGYSVRESRSR